MEEQKGGYIDCKKFKELINTPNCILNNHLFIDELRAFAQIRLESELAFSKPKPDMTAFLNVSLPESSDDRVDAVVLAFQGLTIRKPWWVKVFRWLFHRG